MNQQATFAVAGRNVTLVAEDHITGSFGSLRRNVTLGTGTLAALFAEARHITFGELQRRIESTLVRVQPLDAHAGRVPLRLEVGLLPLLHALHEIQLTAIAEPQSRPFARHGGGLYAWVVAEGGFALGVVTSSCTLIGSLLSQREREGYGVGWLVKDDDDVEACDDCYRTDGTHDPEVEH